MRARQVDTERSATEAVGESGMTPNEQLLIAAKRALEYFTTPGHRQGMYDDLICGRMLRAAIEAVEQAEQPHRPEEVMVRR